MTSSPHYTTDYDLASRWPEAIPPAPAPEDLKEPNRGVSSALKRTMNKILVSGRIYDCARPGEDPRLTLDEIAHSMANIFRWGGACRQAFSDAEHSLSMASAVPESDPLLALACIWHDADEPFFGDMTTEIKRQPEMAWYRQAANECKASLIARFAPELISFDRWAEVKTLDQRSMMTERQWFPYKEPGYQWPFKEDLQPIRLRRMHPDAARSAWIREHYLYQQRIANQK